MSFVKRWTCWSWNEVIFIKDQVAVCKKYSCCYNTVSGKIDNIWKRKHILRNSTFLFLQNLLCRPKAHVTSEPPKNKNLVNKFYTNFIKATSKHLKGRLWPPCRERFCIISRTVLHQFQFHNFYIWKQWPNSINRIFGCRGVGHNTSVIVFGTVQICNTW